MERELSGWGMIFDTLTGNLVSRATVVEDPLPDGLDLVERPLDIDPVSERWDTFTRRIVPYTNAQKAQGLRAQAAALNAAADKIAP